MATMPETRQERYRYYEMSSKYISEKTLKNSFLYPIVLGTQRASFNVAKLITGCIVLFPDLFFPFGFFFFFSLCVYKVHR